ncbi:MAG: histidine kinase [Bacteroidetes bacterium]|nr:histidine kinase [Bacteroidota bacterium]
MTNSLKALTIGDTFFSRNSKFVSMLWRNPNWKLLLSCTLIWLAFFAYRTYFWQDIRIHSRQIVLNTLADAFLSCACGFLIYYLQIRKIFGRIFLPVVLALIATCSFILYQSHILVYGSFGLLTPEFRGLFDSVCFQLLDSVAIVISGALVVIVQKQHYDRNQIERAMEIMELENQRVELKYLKSQMDPHFVFNGLNMIYHQVPENNAAARESLLQFSGILRYHLQYAAGDKVSLKEEMDYLKCYVSFQKKRTRDFMDIQAEFRASGEDMGIEPLLLLPLVENAVKFCNGNQLGKGKMKLIMRCENKKLEIFVQNTYSPKTILKRQGSNIGLRNLKRRLDILYPGRHFLELVNQPEKSLFTCELKIW